METSKTEWKEWVSLKRLTDRIPQQYQHGFSVSPLSLTCLDAYPDHLVFGTNVGLIYLVHLPSFNIIKLKCEDTSSSISSITSVSSVDDMIAAGDHKGCITIFQIPSASSNVLTTSQDSSTLKDYFEPRSPKRFTLSVHRTTITSLVWSKNTMKLFSGDIEGNVCLVEVEYEKCECTGKFLFKVDSRIVQLSYSHQKLAVSYKERCLIYNLTNGSKVFIGTKPRSPPGYFGCTFAPSSNSLQEDIIYCSRPGKKIWTANTKGEVLYSYIHKKLPSDALIHLKDTLSNSYQQNCDFSFNFLHHYKGSVLVSHSDKCLIILDVSNQKVLGYCFDFQRICDVACSGDNVFILENNRILICVSPVKPSFGINPLTSSIHLPLQENLNFKSFSEIRNKVPLSNKQFIDGIAKLSETVASKLSEMKLSEITAPTIISGRKTSAEEGNSLLNSKDYFETNQNSKTNEFRSVSNIPKSYFFALGSGAAIQAVKNERAKASKELQNLHPEDQFNEPSENLEENCKCTDHPSQERDSVVVLPSKVKRKTKKKMDENADYSVIQEKLTPSNETKEFNNDSRTYEDFKEMIEENESVLAEVLDLSCLKMDHEVSKLGTDVTVGELGDQSINFQKPEASSNYPLCSSVNSLDDLNSYSSSYKEAFRPAPSSHHGGLHSHDSLDSKIYDAYMSKDLSYGPPSGSSAIHSSLEENVCSLGFVSEILKNENYDLTDTLTETHVFNTMPPPEDLPWGWQKHHLPTKPVGLWGHGQSIYLSEFKDLYLSSSFSSTEDKLPSWKRKRLLIEIVSFCSYEEDVFLLTKEGLVINVNRENLLTSSPLNFRVIKTSKPVVDAAYSQGNLWLLYEDRKVFARKISERNQLEVDIVCQELQFKNIVCRDGVVWGLTCKGRIAYRIGVRPDMPFGIEWGIMLHPNEVKCIHLSENGLGWMLDAQDHLYVTFYVSQSCPQGLDGRWWQVAMSDCMLFEKKRRDQESEGSPGKQKVLITSNAHFLCLAHPDGPFAYHHSIRSFICHRWDRLGEDAFSSISGEGIFKSYGILYCLNKSGDLFAVSSHSDKIVPIELPNREKLACSSSRPESLWALTKSGKIFIRTGLSITSVLGLKWVQLDLHQIADIKLKHISLSSEVVWGVDTEGKVYLRQGPLSAPNTKSKGLDPAWLLVDSNELNGTVFEKVYAGNNSHMVWGIDSAYRIYVREAIFPELSTGTSWVLVPGLYAQALSISDDRVFAVTSSDHSNGGQIFEREGISSTNYIGNSWKRIPTHSIPFQEITASVDNCLWGLDTKGNIFKHSTLSLFDVDLEGKVPGVEYHRLSSSDFEDWEII